MPRDSHSSLRAPGAFSSHSNISKAVAALSVLRYGSRTSNHKANMFLLAIVLGVVEGMTEFLPVSSTGHLILLVDMLGFKGPEGKSFEIIIQMGAILAICWLYRQKLTTTASGVVLRNRTDLSFCLKLLVACAPALVAGALLGDTIKEMLFNPVSVSYALIVGGVVIWLVETFRPASPRFNSIEALSLRRCLLIGLCQCLALFPGTSRSGATIIGALLLGVERKTAAEFSFFLAIPTMLAATVYSVAANWSVLSMNDAGLILGGFVAAFMSALVVVRWAIGYIARQGFALFAYYRILLGSLMLLIHYGHF